MIGIKIVIYAKENLGTVLKNHQFFGDFKDCPKFYKH